jgi:hypothetical protein
MKLNTFNAKIPVVKNISIFLKATWLYLAGIISVLTVYILLISVSQGTDVVIQSGEHRGPAIFMVISTILWALLLWYSARTLSYIKRGAKVQTGKISAGLHRHFPRIIAFNCYVSIQAAILSLPSCHYFNGLNELNGWCLFLYILLQNAFYFAFSKSLIKGARRSIKLAAMFFIVAYGLLLTYLIIAAPKDNLINGENRHEFWLRLILAILFILECLTILFFIYRRKIVNRIIPTQPPASARSPITWRMGKIFPPNFIVSETRFFKIFNIVGLIALIIYLSGIFCIWISCHMGALAFVLLALGILTGLANIITFVSIRVRINLFLFIYILAFLLGLVYDPYCVRMTASNQTFTYADRPTTQQYIKKWFDIKLKMMDSIAPYNQNAPFDVYIVLSNGGASRAGHWSSSVLSKLQDTSYNKNPRNTFNDHILCIAGASGGTVGNSVFYGLLKAHHDKRISGNSFSDYSASFFKKDFLTFTLARLLGPDLFQHILPLPFIDTRDDVLERTLSESLPPRGEPQERNQILKYYFDQPFSAVSDTSGYLPLLFINSTQVDNGNPGVISTARLPNEGPNQSQRADLLALVDKVKMESNDYKTDIRYSTAAILSSRFPYVSPAGKIYNKYFVDGGYFDNSGAGTVLEFSHELIKYLDTIPAATRNRFTFHILHLTNSEIFIKPKKDIHPLTNDMASPLITLMGMQGSSTSISDGILRHYFAERFKNTSANAYIEFSLYDADYRKAHTDPNDFETDYPMSWVISDHHFARMQEALKRETMKNYKQLEFLNLH